MSTQATTKTGKRKVFRSQINVKVSISLRRVTLERLDKAIEHDGLNRSMMVDYMMSKALDDRDLMMAERAVTKDTKI